MPTKIAAARKHRPIADNATVDHHDWATSCGRTVGARSLAARKIASGTRSS